MDALEFLKERKKMCTLHKSCNGCPLQEAHCGLSSGTADVDYERVIAIVEQWSVEHPRKTRQSEFLKQWPNAKIFVDGVLDLCPMELDGNYSCKSTDTQMRCQFCRREFWMQEVE